MKIKEGKYYRTRDGRKAFTHRNGEDLTYPFYYTADNCSYHGVTSNGKSCIDCNEDDLVSVWGESADDYATLRAILDDAYAQAASGKGKERHANDRPFLQQPICEIGRMLGSVCDGELYQAIKKAQEASNMLARGENKRAEAELLGAINYLAAAVILIRESEHGK